MSENDVINLSGPVKINLSEIKDDLVAEGWHSVKIERAEAKLTRRQKLPSIFVMARITDENDEDHNRTIIWNSMFSGEGLRFTKRFFEAVDMPEELDYPTYQDMANELIGRECECKVKHRTHNGEKQTNVSDWRPIQFDLDVEFDDLE
ncbi:MAG: DUF669 domain-containing protein [Acholeplasmataceae bacterium]